MKRSFDGLVLGLALAAVPCQRVPIAPETAAHVQCILEGSVDERRAATCALAALGEAEALDAVRVLLTARRRSGLALSPGRVEILSAREDVDGLPLPEAYLRSEVWLREGPVGARRESDQSRGAQGGPCEVGCRLIEGWGPGAALVPELCAMLQPASPFHVRAAAAHALAARGDPRALAPLAALLGSEPLGACAITALARFGPPADAFVIAALRTTVAAEEGACAAKAANARVAHEIGVARKFATPVGRHCRAALEARNDRHRLRPSLASRSDAQPVGLRPQAAMWYLARHVARVPFEVLVEVADRLDGRHHAAALTVLVEAGQRAEGPLLRQLGRGGVVAERAVAGLNLLPGRAGPAFAAMLATARDASAAPVTRALALRYVAESPCSTGLLAELARLAAAPGDRTVRTAAVRTLGAVAASKRAASALLLAIATSDAPKGVCAAALRTAVECDPSAETRRSLEGLADDPTAPCVLRMDAYHLLSVTRWRDSAAARQPCR